MSLIDNKQIFHTVEFDAWAHDTGLRPVEKYLIGNYLDKRAKTLEAGTGGGRILLEMKRLGFSSLYGFDYVPRMVKEARKKDPSGSICFDIQEENINYK